MKGQGFGYAYKCNCPQPWNRCMLLALLTLGYCVLSVSIHGWTIEAQLCYFLGIVCGSAWAPTISSCVSMMTYPNSFLFKHTSHGDGYPRFIQNFVSQGVLWCFILTFQASFSSSCIVSSSRYLMLGVIQLLPFLFGVIYLIFIKKFSGEYFYQHFFHQMCECQ